ncbi:MAG: anaerobic ribonucleoside-triphosphate reductase activating protein [Patescibacteria group bacterium]|jgi:pyruvate formate lyase activating enzyme
MQIAGLAKTTLVDFPGLVAATVFTRGCNFKCHYCHNPELVLPEKFNPLIPEEDFFEFLESRYGKLGGVCITGGEPTIHNDLPQFISHIKALGFQVKLDTNGTNPELLEKIIKDGDVDYIAMDIKSPIDKYRDVANFQFPISNFKKNSKSKKPPAASCKLIAGVQKSVKLIMNSDISYEFRTTLAKPLHNIDDMIGIGKMIKGTNKYVIQNYLKTKQISEEMKLAPFLDKELREMANAIKPFVKSVEIR